MEDGEEVPDIIKGATKPAPIRRWIREEMGVVPETYCDEEIDIDEDPVSFGTISACLDELQSLRDRAGVLHGMTTSLGDEEKIRRTEEYVRLLRERGGALLGMIASLEGEIRRIEEIRGMKEDLAIIEEEEMWAPGGRAVHVHKLVACTTGMTRRVEEPRTSQGQNPHLQELFGGSFDRLLRKTYLWPVPPLELTTRRLQHIFKKSSKEPCLLLLPTLSSRGLVPYVYPAWAVSAVMSPFRLANLWRPGDRTFHAFSWWMDISYGYRDFYTLFAAFVTSLWYTDLDLWAVTVDTSSSMKKLRAIRRIRESRRNERVPGVRTVGVLVINFSSFIERIDMIE